jgi:LPS export ABC transporter protein LptC
MTTQKMCHLNRKVATRFNALMLWGLLPTLVGSLGSCGWRAPTPVSSTQPVAGGVALSQVVLTQTDTKGQPLWKLTARGVTYSENRQVARAKALKGQLYSAKQPTFDIAAETATIRQSNQQIRLQGKIQVVDRQRKTLFSSREALWDPKSGQLMVEDGLTVSHPQVQIWAQTLRASERGKTVQVKGNVVIETRPEQSDGARLRMKTNQALWQLDQEWIQAGMVTTNGDQPTIAVERLGSGKNQVSAVAGMVQADLKRRTVVMRSPVQVQGDGLTLTSKTLTWDTKAQRIFTQELLKIQDPRRQVSLLANQGAWEPQRGLVELQGEVSMKGLRERAQLNTDRLLWNTQTQRIEANGNVNYVQASPAFTLRGPKAVGRLAEQAIRISGGNVVTEIVP